jgi:hypothetical protein
MIAFTSSFTTSVLSPEDFAPPAIVRMWDQASQSVSVLLTSDEWPTPTNTPLAQLLDEGMATVRSLAILPVDPEADRLMSEWIAEQPASGQRKRLIPRK